MSSSSKKKTSTPTTPQVDDSSPPPKTQPSIEDLLIGMENRLSSQISSIEVRVTSLENKNSPIMVKSDTSDSSEKDPSPISTSGSDHEPKLKMSRPDPTTLFGPEASNDGPNVLLSSSTDFLDVTQNFPLASSSTPPLPSRRQSIEPSEYRQATMSVNYKTDIPPFTSMLKSFRPDAVLSFMENMDQYLMRHFKITYSTHPQLTDQYVVVTQQVGDTFRANLQTLLREPSCIASVVDDSKWLNMSNVLFFRLTRMAMQPTSEHSYFQTLRYNVPSVADLRDITSINVFNWHKKIPPLKKFLTEFVRVHTYLNMQAEYPNEPLVQSSVPDVNDFANGSSKCLKLLLTEKCGAEFADGLINLSTSKLRAFLREQQSRRSNYRPGVIPPTPSRPTVQKFVDVDELIRYVTKVLNEFTDLYRELDKFRSFHFRRRTGGFHSSSSSPSSTVHQLGDYDADSHADDDDDSDSEPSFDSPPVKVFAVSNSGSTGFGSSGKPSVCWQFLRNGECSMRRGGQSCPYSHAPGAIADFASAELPKIVGVVNKCIPDQSMRFALHRNSSSCNAKREGSTSFQPSHRKFDKLQGSRTPPPRPSYGPPRSNAPRSVMRIQPRPPSATPPLYPPTGSDVIELSDHSDHSPNFDDSTDVDEDNVPMDMSHPPSHSM